METKIIKPSQVKIDMKLYPRYKVDYVTKARYYNAMKSGAEFPNIVVAEKKGMLGRKTYILVDGGHRLDAIKDLKLADISVDVLTGLTDKEIYLEAIKRNITHGRQFSSQEVAKICLTMKEWNMSNEEISQLVRIPADKLKDFVGSRLSTTTNSDGVISQIILKSPMKNMAGTDMSGDTENEQDRVGGSSQIQLLDSVIILFENNWINLESAIVKARVNKLYKLISALKIS